MRILAVTNMYPTVEEPFVGTFIEQQIKGLRQFGMKVEVVFLNRRRDGMRAYLTAGRQVQEKIQEFKPDLIHVMYGGVMAERVTRAISGCPTVVSFCGSDLLGELLSGWRRKTLAAYGVWCSWRAANRARGIVVKSKNLERALPKRVDRKKVRVIPNGVDLDRFLPIDQDLCRSRVGWDRETFRVLFPANVGDPRKRPWLAQKAIEGLAASGIKSAIFRLEGIPHEQVPIWLNASDCVLITSLFEGSVNVVKEALACNVPVVSVDVGDVAELIAGVEGCYLAEPNSCDLAGKLAKVQARSKRVEGREKMRELSLDRVASRLSNFYQEMLVA